MDDTQKSCNVSNVRNVYNSWNVHHEVVYQWSTLRFPPLLWWDRVRGLTSSTHVSPIYSLVTDRRFHRYLARILPRRLRSFCKHSSPHLAIKVYGPDKKSMTDDGMPPGSLSLRSQAYHLYMKTIPLSLSSTWVFSLKPLNLLSPPSGRVCIVKLLRAGLLTWMRESMGGFFRLVFYFLNVLLWVCTFQSRSADSFWSHIRNHNLRLLLSLLLLYSPCPSYPALLRAWW